MVGFGLESNGKGFKSYPLYARRLEDDERERADVLFGFIYDEVIVPKLLQSKSEEPSLRPST